MTDIAELGLRIRADGAQEATTQLDRLTTTAGRTERAAANLNTNIQSVGSGFNAFGPQVQQASFQIQDFAVQVGAGTSATQALSQQLPQLLGGFGAWGAAIGALVAIGGGLATVLMKSGGAAETFADRMDDLSEAVDGYREAVDSSLQTTAELVAEFGTVAAAMREPLRLARELSFEKSVSALRDQVGGFKTEFQSAFDLLKAASGDLDNLTAAQRASIAIDPNAMRGAYNEVREELGLTTAEALELRDALDNLTAATGPTEVVAAADALSRLIRNTYETAGDIPPEIAAIATAANEAASNAGQLQAGLEESEDAARSVASTDMASGISAAADEASRLAGEISNAVTGMIDFAAQSAVARRESEIMLKYAGDPVGAAGALAASRTDISGLDPILQEALSDERAQAIADAEAAARNSEALAEINKAATRSARAGRKAGKSGGGGISEAERELEQFSRGLERFRTEEQQLLADLIKLEEGFARFGDQLSPEQVELYGQAMADLRGDILEAQTGITEFGREAASVFPSISEIMDDTRGAAQRLLSTLADRAWTAGAEGLFSAFGPRGGKASGGLFGGTIIPGILHSGGIAGDDGYDHNRRVSAAIFRDAERYHNGGMVGLKPDEVPIIAEKGERVIPKGQQVKAEPVNVHVTVGMDESGNLQVRKIARSEAANVSKSNTRAMADMRYLREGR